MRLSWIGPVLATSLPMFVYYGIQSSPFDSLVPTPSGHFVIVSAVSILAAIFAGLVGAAGIRQRNIQVVFLALAFLSLATLFTLHGLSTPGFLLGPNPVPEISAQLSTVLAAAWMALSAVSSDHKAVVWLGRKPGLLVSVWVITLVAALVHSLVDPQAWGIVPPDAPALRWSATLLCIAFATFAAARYWNSYVSSHLPLPLAIVYAAVWIGEAQWIMTTSEVWRISWWLYHFLLLGAVLALSVGIFRQFVLGESLQQAVRELLLSDPVERIEVGLSPSVRALVIATEARDPYTAGHSYRVAITAVRLGQELGLSPTELRALAVGGLIHDVGKIEVPDRILNKPGPLTPEERKTIQRHPDSGYRMCRNLGFMEEELAIIRHHHERWDGSGYPDGLAGEAIPKLARVVAIADVYDALTSERSYRPALSHEEAARIIVSESGRSFDPAIVEVWLRLIDAGPVVESAKMPPWSSLAAADAAVS